MLHQQTPSAIDGANAAQHLARVLLHEEHLARLRVAHPQAAVPATVGQIPAAGRPCGSTALAILFIWKLSSKFPDAASTTAIWPVVLLMAIRLPSGENAMPSNAR
jgi:hypothetical protein